MNRLFVSILSLAVLAGCNNPLTNTLPSVNGKANEIIMVAEGSLWDSQAGDSLRHVFGIPVPGLPQDEPYFNMVHIDYLRFAKSSLYQKHRNICRIAVSDTLKNEIKGADDIWATPQFVMEINASCDDSLIAMLGRESELIRQAFMTKEQTRLRNIIEHGVNLHIKNALEQDHNISLTAPGAWSLDVNHPDFVWISTEEKGGIQLGVLIWHYAYTDQSQFSRDSLLATRNRFVKFNVPGPRDGSYMATDTTNYETIYEPYEKDGKYFVRMRGLWYTENYFMGGPFISISTTNEKMGEIVTADGYVYAPQKDKRNYVRQLEAILASLETDK